MTAKGFLRRARSVDRRVDEAAERVKRLRARLEAGRMSRITGMPRGGSEDWTATADKLIELEKRVNARIRDLCALKHAAMDAIDAIDGKDEAQLRELLELYYIDGYTWDKVAEIMNLDKRWIFRLHGRALQRINVPEEVR